MPTLSEDHAESKHLGNPDPDCVECKRSEGIFAYYERHAAAHTNSGD